MLELQFLSTARGLDRILGVAWKSQDDGVKRATATAKTVSTANSCLADICELETGNGKNRQRQEQAAARTGNGKKDAKIAKVTRRSQRN